MTDKIHFTQRANNTLKLDILFEFEPSLFWFDSLCDDHGQTLEVTNVTKIIQEAIGSQF